MKRLLAALLLIPSLALAQTPRQPPPPFHPNPATEIAPPPAEFTPEPAGNAQMAAMDFETMSKMYDALGQSMKAMAPPLQNALNELMAAKRSLDVATKLNKWYEGQLYGVQESTPTK